MPTKYTEICFGEGDTFSDKKKDCILRCVSKEAYYELMKKMGVDNPEPPKQEAPLEDDKYYKYDWTGMPDGRMMDNFIPVVHIQCNTEEMRNKLKDILEIPHQKSFNRPWYPKGCRDTLITDTNTKNSIHYVSPVIEEYMPKYPIYVISYKRADIKKCRTIYHLNEMEVNHYLVIEEHQEFDYDLMLSNAPNGGKYSTIRTFKRRPEEEGKGGIPARNWCWDDSVLSGYEKHWILDDNIDGFYRKYKNSMILIKKGGACFRVLEDYANRFKYIGILGHGYKSDVKGISRQRPIVRSNTKVYSSILINNDLRTKLGDGDGWRGKYNEDIDLCIRTIENGLCTMINELFIINKMSTSTVKGGNSDIYSGDGFLQKLHQLRESFPEYWDKKIIKSSNKLKGHIHHDIVWEKINGSNITPQYSDDWIPNTSVFDSTRSCKEYGMVLCN